MPRDSVPDSVIQNPVTRDPARGLEVAVEEAVTACGGDVRAAVRALLVTLDAMEGELEALKAEVARIEAAVSGGTVRNKVERREIGGS